MKKPKVATASEPTVKQQIASYTLENARLKEEKQRLLAENTVLRKKNVELASVIENDLKADLKLKICSLSKYKEADLDSLSIEELQRIEETLMKSSGLDASTATFKSIRAGDTADNTGRLTVGSLYGKTRKEILEMGGDF